MTATMRLFTIEARRSVALWFFPLMALVACWYAVNLNTRMEAFGVAIWPHNSAKIGESLVVLAPLMGGVAAWSAGRDHRRDVGDLLATTPRPAPLRDLAAWGGTAIWGALAYFAVGAFIVGVSLRDDAWGSPLVAPVVIGLLTVVAAAAIGYSIGTHISGRLVPPLVPIVLFYAIMLLNSEWFIDDRVSMLSPWTTIENFLYQNSNDVFYAEPPSYLLSMTLWLIGLTGMSLALVGVYRQRLPKTWAALTASTLVAMSGAFTLMGVHEPRDWNRLPWEGREVVAYTPACVQRSIPVCVHPAFESRLTPYADRIGRLVEPLLGLPGAPIRAEQLPYASGMYADGTLTISPADDGMETAALALVQPPVEPGPGWLMPFDVRPEQAVIATWLAQRVDAGSFEHWDLMLFDPESGGAVRNPIQDEIDAAVDRFSALDPAAQRAWLEANYADLRAGRLNLDDLP